MSKEKNSGSDLSIEVLSDGPLIVKGVEKLTAADGSEIEKHKDVYALCRCGASQNKPFCDGTHNKIGFSGEREISRPLDKVKSYSGRQITIHDNRTICAHAAECVKNLPGVFDLESKPWILPDKASPQEIIAVIKKCPSGALSYTINDELHQEKNLDPEIQIDAGGPYNVRGKISLKVDQDDMQPPNRELYSLCRCGASRNKPFCDGTHHNITFEKSE